MTVDVAAPPRHRGTGLVSYIVRIYISRTGGVEHVGLYNSGFSIISTYVGMIFAAMSTDFYPRLSGVAGDNTKCKSLINQQAEMAVLIITPILAVFLIFIKWVIILFYSIKFVAINELHSGLHKPLNRMTLFFSL